MSVLLSDALARIKNAQLVSHDRVVVRFSKLVQDVIGIFVKEGFVEDVKVFEESKGVKHLEVYLKYLNGDAVISGAKMISKPSRRVYKSCGDIPVASKLGVCVLSTSKGVMADHEAISLGVGGEVLCEIC